MRESIYSREERLSEQRIRAYVEDQIGLANVKSVLDAVYDRIDTTVTPQTPWQITVAKPNSNDPNDTDTYTIIGGHTRKRWLVRLEQTSGQKTICIGLNHVLMRKSVIQIDQGILNFTPAAPTWLEQFEKEMEQLQQQSTSS